MNIIHKGHEIDIHDHTAKIDGYDFKIEYVKLGKNKISVFFEFDDIYDVDSIGDTEDIEYIDCTELDWNEYLKKLINEKKEFEF